MNILLDPTNKPAHESHLKQNQKWPHYRKVTKSAITDHVFKGKEFNEDHSNYLKSEVAAKIGVLRLNTYSQGVIFSGSYKMTGHFLLVKARGGVYLVPHVNENLKNCFT